MALSRTTSWGALLRAYNFIFALFPLMILLLSLFGLFALHRAALLHRFLSYFSDLLPRRF